MYYLNIRVYFQLGTCSVDTLVLSYWGQKTYWAAISPKPYFQFLQTRPHFIQNPGGNLINSSNIKLKLKPGFWGLKTRSCTNWAQETYQVISLEPWLQFPQTKPHFIQNQKANSIIFSNLQMSPKCLGPKNHFWPTGPKRFTKL